MRQSDELSAKKRVTNNLLLVTLFLFMYHNSLEREAINALISNKIASATQSIAQQEPWRLCLFGALVIGIIIVAFGASYFLLRFKYSLDEEKMAEIVAKLNKDKGEASEEVEAQPAE